MVAFSLSWLPSSCSKHSAKPAAKGGDSSATIAANPNDFGELDMTNNTEAIVHFGSGKTCRIMPRVVDRKNVELTMTLETQQSNGKIGSMTIARAVAPVGTPVEMKVGDTDMSLTPVIVEP